MKKITVAFFCLYLCLTACKQTDIKEKEASPYVFKITDVEKKEKILFSDLFKDVKVIPLETSDSCLVSRIESVRYRDNKFFILDPDQDIIFIFDNEGHFLNKISKKGKGPGEYVDIRSFDVDAKDKLITIASYKKIIFYDFQGTYIKEKPLSSSSCDLSLSDKHILIYPGFSSSNINGKQEGYLLVIKDKEGFETKGYVPFDVSKMEGHTMSYQKSGAFSPFKDETLFYYPFSNNIYSIQGDSVSIKYIVDLGKHNLPSDYFDNFLTSKEAFDNLRNSSYAFAFNHCWENDRYFAIDLHVGENGLSCLYDKNEKKMKTGYYSDDMASQPFFAEVTDDYVVGFAEVDDILMSVEYQKKKGMKLNDKESELLLQINEDSNPILFMYYFK